MQWYKFEAFVASHLDLAPCLTEQLKPFSGSPTMQQIVENQLEYIAVRPWESLDLSAAGDYKTIDVGKVNVTYTVYAHIEGNEAPCARAVKSYASDPSVGELISGLMSWHGIYWANEVDRPLVFDAVVRRSRKIHYTSRTLSADKTTLSFYLFPQGYTPA